MKQILVTGLCTLHWGRLQYGNVGNYYIVEPLFRELHKWFPSYKIATTFQMDEEFINKENIKVVPMEYYYAWQGEKDIENAIADVECAKRYVEGENVELTPFLKEVDKCEYIIDVSGDMWGDNAEHVGHKRFYVNCMKIMAAQIMKKKTILYAVTPGPFANREENEIAKQVFKRYNKVFIREKVSMKNLIEWDFDISNVEYAPCPSFLFEQNEAYESKWTEWIKQKKKTGKKVIGLTFGGFNMPCGPYDMWPRLENQYETFKKLVLYIMNELECCVMLFSHTNGFNLPPDFKLISGRDYQILNQLYELLDSNNENLMLISEPLLPCNIKKVIGTLDMLITGRVHASVASVSQCVPTVFVEYDRNVIYSDKMMGFSEQTGMERYVCQPNDYSKLEMNVNNCFTHLDEVKQILEKKIPILKFEADHAFMEMASI